MSGIIHYRANIDPTINQVCDIGLSKHVCFNREVNDIAYIGIVGSSLACFPIDGMRLLSMLFIADIFVRSNAASLYLSPHIPELSLTQGKSTAITNNKIRGNALFDFFQMIEKGHWNRYITVASCGLGHIGNLRTIVAENTCTRIGVLLKTIFKVAKKSCHCDCPGSEAELPSYRSKRIEVFCDQEIASLARKILASPDMTGLCVLLVLNTGLRLGEICALRKSDIDFHSGFLRIERSAARVRDGSGTRLVVQAPKSNSSVRLVAVPNDMLELMKTATRSIREDNYLLANTDMPMEPRTLQYRYRKLLERCGIRYRNFHALRHTYATRCMESGVDIKSLSELLGHADIRTTLQTYVHSSLAHKKQAVQSICFLPIESTWGSLIPSKIPSEMPQSDALQRRADAGVVNCI